MNESEFKKSEYYRSHIGNLFGILDTCSCIINFTLQEIPYPCERHQGISFLDVHNEHKKMNEIVDSTEKEIVKEFYKGATSEELAERYPDFFAVDENQSIFSKIREALKL